jgi:hypothetical protein
MNNQSDKRSVSKREEIGGDDGVTGGLLINERIILDLYTTMLIE